MNVTVLGAGVIGLTTALALEQARPDLSVRVVARQRGTHETSGKAGAMWFPFSAHHERIPVWAERTRRWLAEIAARSPEAGVDLLTLQEARDDLVPEPWIRSLPEFTASPEDLPKAWKQGWQCVVPRVDPGTFLPWLEGQLRGSVEIGHTVTSLDEVAGDRLINCTGLGSRDLLDDREFEPRLGQLALVERGELSDRILVDERDPERLFYVVPRREGFILGGTYVLSHDKDVPPPDPAVEADLLNRCRAAGFEPGRVLESTTGLRPVRTTVRLEREGRVVHNYGHGGSGFTLAWGCAEDVVELLR